MKLGASPRNVLFVLVMLISLALFVDSFIFSFLFPTPTFSAFLVDETLLPQSTSSTKSKQSIAKPKYKIYSPFTMDDYHDDFELGPNASTSPAMTNAYVLSQIKRQPYTNPSIPVLPSQQFAREFLTPVWRQIGKGRGPFILGGIGDSGTRGVHDLFEELGIYCLHQGEVIAISKDARPFMKSRIVTTSDGMQVERKAFDLYMDAIWRSGSLNYNLSQVPLERAALAEQWIGQTLLEILELFKRYRTNFQLEGGAQSHAFGFKHPRTALMLPYWLASLGPKFTFIHILRDGREVSHGNNLHVFDDICNAYTGSAIRCQHRRKVEMWADMNQDIFDFARANLLPHQYYAIRIEDLVMGYRHCYDHLTEFLQLKMTAKMNATVDRVMRNVMMPHISSYLGNKFPAPHDLTKLEFLSPKVRRALRFWGYDVHELRLKTDCLDLPWLRLLRR